MSWLQGQIAATVVLIGMLSGCAPETMPTVTDTSAPRIAVSEPGQGDRVETFTPTIRVDYGDDRSGVRVVTFGATINGREYSAEFDHHIGGAVGEISQVRPIPLGWNHLEVEIADRNGNVGQSSVDFLNAAGGWLNVKTVPDAAPARSVELVFDASGSMGWALGATTATRMEVAKEALRSLVVNIPEGMPLGLRVFYACGNIRSLVPIQPVDRKSFLERIDSIQPYEGTPIVESLIQSFEALRKQGQGQRVTVLVTDGGESCGGSLKTVVNQAQDAKVRVVVIGFDIDSSGLLQQLSELAGSTNGAYVDARHGTALKQALKDSVLRFTYQVFDDKGNPVTEGQVDGKRLELPTGVVSVRLDTIPPVVIRGVEIGRLTDTTVTIRRANGSGIDHEVARPVAADLPGDPVGDKSEKDGVEDKLKDIFK